MVAEGCFNADILNKIAGRERLSKSALILYRVLVKTGLTDTYWNGMLKKNKAFDNRYNKPYT